MAIKLYDTLTKSKKKLSASDGQRFRFYCCGPTVYASAHIGNFRTFLIQDVLRRALEIEGLNPFHVRNLTDVDDKTIRLSQEKGIPLEDFTQKWTEKFHADCQDLNMLPPHKEPAAADHIPQQIDLIQKLIENGHAYTAPDGSVYYKVSSFKGYGKLAHINCQHLRTQATTSDGTTTNSADEYDRDNVADFALWKAHKEEDGPNAWDSPWGKGRPGWHIECSAMSREYLGDTLDLHAGGVDLTFPHHENEIAQSEGVTGKPFALHWFHSAHLRVDGEKMSKSLGNLFTVKDIKEKGYPPMTLRYLLISGHYRQPFNFTIDGLSAAHSAIQKLEKAVLYLLKKANLEQPDWLTLAQAPHNENWGSLTPFWHALCDDLNTPAALGALFIAIKALERADISPEQSNIELLALAKVFYTLGLELFTETKKEAPIKAINLAQQRWEAKQSKDFAKADELRDQLESIGWKSLDNKDSYTLEPIH